MIATILAPALLAFNPPVDEAALEGGGKIVLSIGEVPEVVERGKAVSVAIEVSSSGSREVAGTLTIGLEPSWSIEGPPERSLKVPAGGKAAVEARIAPGPRTHGAHYPVHARLRIRDGGKEKALHAVRVFETRLGPVPPLDEPLAVPAGGALDLSRQRAVRVSWERFGNPRKKMPFGWTGSDPDCRLDFSPGARADRGGSRPAISVHPPWWNGAGTMWADYRVRLPEKGPIRFEASGALRDLAPSEPPSDGVTFRVSAAPAGQGPGEPPPDSEFQLIEEKHVSERTWQPIAADLEKHAGKTIWLRLETHPGPKKDTTCDGAFWGAPRIIAGKARAPAGVEREIDRKEIGRFKDARGSMVPQVSAILQEDSGGRRKGVISFTIAPIDTYAIEFIAETESEAPVEWEVTIREPAIFAKFRSKARIADLAARLRNVGRVYAGFGNIIDLPKSRSTLGAGGEKLTTRHAGFDVGFDAWRRLHPFTPALARQDCFSILVATDLPPDRLEIGLGEDHGTAELHTHGEATFTIVPVRRKEGEATAVWAAALAYRDAVPMEPGPGVERLAGRMVFDVWGGKYRDAARSIERAAALGLRGSVLVWHNWQRWGYDYRLPDIVPPNPEFGSLEEFRELAWVCRENDILFAPHDNYIDFYPDAEGFTYEDICFDDGGRPVRAWNNEWRKAQSYRFRPDRAMPYVRRNLEWIAREIAPTAYFIDVFASINAFDFRDAAGAFHPQTETVARWKEIFERCRTVLGSNAPQISEDGNDWMIGSVDGGQGNFQRVGKPGPGKNDPWAVWNLECGDAERIPWFDAVHHDRMVLHGAGYGTRYAGGEDMKEHGTDSDDYTATEALTGHPPMASAIDSPGAIRKGWLLGPLGRALAGKKMRSFEFAGGSIHRQRVLWEGGIEVLVNRGKDDWKVGDQVLPQYGFLARRGRDMIASRVKVGDEVWAYSEEPGAKVVMGPVLAERFETGDPRHVDVLSVPASKAAGLKMPIDGKVLSGRRPVEVRALRIEGARRVEGEKIDFSIAEGSLSFGRRPADAGYRIHLEKPLERPPEKPAK